MAKKSFIEIDEFDLQQEWSDHSPLYLEHADALAEAEGDLLEADAEFELVKAEVGTAIRRNPNAFGIPAKPVTLFASASKEALIISQEYQDAQRAVIKAKKRVLHLKAAVRSLEHKKTALENKVYLRGQGYFSDKPKKRLEKYSSDGEALRNLRKRSIRKPLRRRDDDSD